MGQPEPSDAALVAAVRDGDVRAMELLFRRHASRINGLVFRLMGSRSDLGDLVQETFVRALESIGSLRNPDAFAGWLSGIAVFTVRKELSRRRWRARFGLHNYEPIRPEHIVSQNASANDRFELVQLYHGLESLPEPHRVALVLRHVEGCTLPEIAEMMNVSLATVKRWIDRAERALTGRSA